MRLAFYDNPYLLWLTVAIIAVAGLSALISLPRLEDPRITNRNPLIVTEVPGASAERVETLVTEVLEEALEEVSEIKTVDSTSRAGVSLIAVELKDRVTTAGNDEIFSKMRDRLGDAAADLPAEAGAPFLDDQRDPVAFTLILGLVWERPGTPNLTLLDRHAEELARRLRALKGTELVRRYGEIDEEITVTADARALADLGLPVAQAARRIAAADAKLPAGQLRGADRDAVIEVEGALDAIERVRQIPLIETEQGSVVRVGDVAQVVRDRRTPPMEIARTGGRRTVFVAARMEQGVRIDRWTPRAFAIVADYGARLGSGIAVETVFDQSVYTEDRLADLAFNLALGVGVVMIVVLATMGWRSGLIVGSAIPLVFASVLFALLLVDGALHQMSIFGMIIALGLLIDNAIVVTDEVTARLRKGESRRAAVAGALGHLFAPLLASSLTTVLAFAPIVLLPGNAGDFVGWIGGSVLFAIVFSFMLSMTVIAALAGRYVRFEGARRWWHQGLDVPALAALTRRLLGGGLKRPWLGMALAAAPALLGFAVAPFLGNQFFPPVDRNMFEIEVKLDEQTAIARSYELVTAMEARILKAPEVARVHWLAGGSFPSVYYNLTMDQDRASHYAQAIVETGTADGTEALIPRLQAILDAAFPAAQILVRQFGQGPPVDADVQYRLYGPDRAVLQDLGERMRRALQAHPDVLHSWMTMGRGLPKLWVEADEDAARLAGLTLADLAGQLQGNLEGYRGGSVLEGLENLPVRVRLAEDVRGSLAAIASTDFLRPAAAGADAQWTPLAALGRIALRPEPAAVTRYDSRRTNMVEASTRNEALPIDVTYEVLDALEAEGFDLPPGYEIELGGSVETDSEAVGNLMQFVPTITVLMIATLILAFKSLRLAGILFVVVGLSVGLGQLATFSIGFPVSFNTILGTLGLIGIALNDSIVVLASIRDNPRAAAGEHAAVIDAVMGCGRHVASTTLTTMGGFLPLLLFIGGDFWPSLAIVLAGGIAGATLIAVFFVPAAYVLLRRRRERGEAAPA